MFIVKWLNVIIHSYFFKLISDFIYQLIYQFILIFFLVMKIAYLINYKYVANFYWESPRGVQDNVLNYVIVVSEFELQSHYYVHIRINTIGKGMNLVIP